MGETVACVAAHADDETLGAGGALARHLRRGDRVVVLVAADCRSARPGWGRAPALLEEALRAAEALGGAEVRFLGLGGMTLRDRELELTRLVEGHLVEVRPDVVYAHLERDLNSDHGAASRAVAVATRPCGAWQPGRVLQFEVPSSTGWETPATFSPGWFVELSEEDLEAKCEALSRYGGENRPPPHPRNAEALRARAAYWGQQCGRRLAEPFRLARLVEDAEGRRRRRTPDSTSGGAGERLSGG